MFSSPSHKKKSVLFFFIFSFIASLVFSQTTNISGIVNSYSPVTVISSCSIEVSDASAFGIGNRVIIIQMKGATIDSTNTSNFGNVLNLNSCGNYEFGHVSMILGNTIFLTAPLQRTYDATGAVQLIKVPQYTNAIITAPITCPNWNGSSGGVVVIECSGSLTFNSNIDVKGKGFRLGNYSPQGASCPNGLDYYYPSTSYFGAEKGEGVSSLSLLKQNGMGKLANGGGGGNNGNSGGGGGANFGSGGNGGYTAPGGGCIPEDVGGRGGQSLPYTNLLNKFFLGGGGGGGQEDNIQGTPGTSGGGVTILRANSISGNGNAINAGAFDALPGGCDASGAGGAGGSVLLDVPNFTGILNINVKGGNGAITTCYTQGASGGGGGGCVWSKTSLPNNVAFNVSEGIRGIHGNGSQDGLPGDTLSGLTIVGTSFTFVPLPIVSSPDDSICVAEATILTVSPNGIGYSYNWAPAISLNNSGVFNPIATPVLQTTYSVILTDPNGCKTFDSIKISITKPVAAFKNTEVCFGNATQFTDTSTTVWGIISLWTWDFGDGSSIDNSQNPSHLYSNAGSYNVRLIVSNSVGCSDTITKPVQVYYNPVAGFTSNGACFGDSANFTNTSSVDNSSSITSYVWTFGDGSASSSLIDPNYFYQSAGTYSVTLVTTTIDGCSYTAIINVVVHAPPIAIANSNNPVTVGSAINLSTDTVSGIVWTGPNSFTSAQQNPTITNAQINDSGIYQVIKTNSFGCKDTAEVLVTVYQPEIPDNLIDDDSDGLIDCADPDLATLKQCYVCGYDSIAWKTVVPETGFNKGIAVKYTGFAQHFIVPAGVTAIKVKAWGAGGGGGYTGYNVAAGAGGFTVDQLITLPGETYVVVAGEGGWATRHVNQTARATFGFGGSGNSLGSGATSETGSGGGLSGVFFSTLTHGNARVVAGGGGGIADAGGYDETSGGNGNNPLAGGYLPLTGQNAPANSTGFGGGGGGYVGGISGIHRFSYCGHAGHCPDLYADGGEGGSGFKYTSGGLIKFTPELNIYPPDTADVHYISGAGVGNDYDMTVGAVGDIKTGGNGLVVIQWFEPVDDLTISASKDSICKGDTLTLIASGQSNYLWSPATTLSSDTAKTVIASPINDITYQVISNYNNCKDTATIQIVVHQLPVLTLSPDSSVCIGDSLQINASGAFSYSWFPDTGLNTNYGTAVTAGPIVTTKYYVTGTDNNNCSSTDSLIIIVDTLPIASITGVTSICAGDSTILTASGGDAYLWSNGETAVAIKVSPNSTQTYFVVATNSNNCNDSASFNLVVHPLPLPQFSCANVCDGNSVVFTNISTINPSDTIQSYSWNFGDGSSLNNAQDPSYLFAMDSSYSVQLLAFSNFGCFDSITKLITVNPNPTVNFTANDTTGCAMLCVSLQDLSSINTGNNVTWLWDFGDGSATSNTANANHCYSNNSSPISFNVTLAVTSDSGCVSNLYRNNYISVYPNPTAEFSTANVCFGSLVPFTDLSSIPANTTIQSWAWDFGDGSLINTNQLIPGGYLYTSANDYTVNLVVVSNFGCLDSITKTITVSPNPVVNFSASDTVGCEPLCISFQNSSSVLNGSVFQWAWNVGDGSPGISSQSFDHCYTNDFLVAPHSFDVTLTVTSDSGCFTTVSKNNYITVYPNPDASFTVQPQTTTILDPTISIIDVSKGTDYWNWNFGDGTATSAVSIPAPYTYLDTGTYIITLITSTQYNCIDTAYQTVIIEPDFLFYIPNAFTPDGDGINDTFIGKGVFIKEFEMTIFDRWGNLIYKTDDIDKPWDGKVNKGNEIAQADEYIYLIQATDFKGGKNKYSGHVTLVR